MHETNPSYSTIEYKPWFVKTWPRRRGVPLAALSLIGVVAGGVSAGCTASEEAPAPQEVPRSIPLFADLEFSQHIGDIASYDIVCAYREDKAIPSIHPNNALAYQVVSEDPYGRRGFVDPDRGGVVTGSAPECTDPPYPESLAPSLPTAPNSHVWPAIVRS